MFGLGNWWLERQERRRINAVLDPIIGRLEAGCDEAEFQQSGCPTCGASLTLHSHYRRPLAIVGCSANPAHLQPVLGHHCWARPQTVPEWWKKYQNRDEWDDW